VTYIEQQREITVHGLRHIRHTFAGFLPAALCSEKANKKPKGGENQTLLVYIGTSTYSCRDSIKLSCSMI